MNNVCLIGRITATPELKVTTNGGVNVVSFTLAVDRSYQKKGEERVADFINCVAWRTTAEFISKYFVKGQMMAVVGELQTRNYEDKNGNKRTAVEVIVDQVNFCGKKEGTSNAAEVPLPDNAPPMADDNFMPGAEELPF